MPARKVLALITLALALLLLALAYITWPYGWDQGIYAWMGQSIRSGGVPYLDAWDFKGPTAPYLFALAQTVFPDTPSGLRVFDLVMLAGAAAGTYALARRLFEDVASAACASALLVLWYFALGFWHTAQPDAWVSWLLVGGALVALRSTSPWTLLAAGATLGAAVLLKPPYGVFGLPLLAFAVAPPRRHPVFRALVALGAGAAIVVGLVGLGFARAGALAEAAWSFLDYNLSVYGSPGPGALAALVRRALEWLLHSRVLPAVLPFAALGWMSWRREGAVRVGLGAWAGGALLVTVMQQKFYDYHILPALPPLALLAGHGIAQLWRARREPANGSPPRRQLLALGGAALVLLILQLVVYSGYDVLRWAGRASGRTSIESYLDGFGVAGAEYRVARFLGRTSSPGDSILVWGMNTGVLSMSHRSSWSRFGFNMPLVLLPDRVASRRLRSEFQEAFARSRPHFIVVGEPHGLTGDAPPDTLDCGLAALIGREYALRFSAGPLRVYQHDRAAYALVPLAPAPCPAPRAEDRR